MARRKKEESHELGDNFHTDPLPGEPEPGSESADIASTNNLEPLESEKREAEAEEGTSPIKEQAPLVMPGYTAIETAPKVGIQVMISETGTDMGTRALWKRSRFFKNGKWQMMGKWIEPVTGAEIGFEPRYWREIA